MVQGEKYTIPINYEPFSYDPSSIDTLIVTHGHLDHVGRIPKLVKDGFKGNIISTAPTREIGELIMLDSLGVFGKEAAAQNIERLYEEQDVLKAVHLWDTALEYEKPHTYATDDGEATITLHDAGHILGSAIIEIEYKGKRIAFTGDLGNTPSPLMRDTTLLHHVDYLVMESVYGDRNHTDKDKRVDLLKDAIRSTIKK